MNNDKPEDGDEEIPPEFEIPELHLTEEELASRLDPNAKTYTTEEVLAYAKSLVK